MLSATVVNEFHMNKVQAMRHGYFFKDTAVWTNRDYTEQKNNNNTYCNPCPEWSTWKPLLASQAKETIKGEFSLFDYENN